MMRNLLSVDLEDYFHFIGSVHSYPPTAWDGLESHVCRMTEHLLETLGEHRATFFCLGWVAQKFPHLIREVAAAGHEIASHGMYHEPVFRLGPRAFRQDAERSRKLLEDCCGLPVRAYRAPGFSVRSQDVWFFRMVRRAGYDIDSSLFPGLRTLGGIPGASPYPHDMDLPEGLLHEIPVSTATPLGIRTAFCGGGFFRVFPYWYMRREIRRLNTRGQPAVVYLHPRDIDARQPRLKLEPVNGFLYHYGLDAAEGKWRRLMAEFPWGSFADWLEHGDASVAA